MAVDSARPFPLIQNKSLNIGAILKFKPSNKKDGNGQFRELYVSHQGKKQGDNISDTDFATVQVPSGLPRFVEIPAKNDGDKCFILLEQIIEKILISYL